MSPRTESIISIAAAIFVLFTAMLDPRVAAGLAVLVLVGLGIFKFLVPR
jgi:predicted anti-sigma-YlaC factor YlaD